METFSIPLDGDSECRMGWSAYAGLRRHGVPINAYPGNDGQVELAHPTIVSFHEHVVTNCESLW